MKVLDIKSRAALACAMGLSFFTVPQITFAQDGFSLEEIVVTARKREESLQEVPVAITVFTGNALEEAGIQTTRDLFANTPGLNYDTGFDQNAATPAVRGVVSQEIATYRQKVTSFLDGMPILGQQGSVPFTAIQQVEVLRGPQSAAFGRSTFGGAINYTTRDPGDVFEGSLSVEVGKDGRLNAGGLISGPLVDGVLSYLVAVESNTVDGESDWVTEEEGITLGGQDSKNALVKLIWTPTDKMALEYRFKTLDVDNEQTPRDFFPLDDPNRVIHPDAAATVTECGLATFPPPVSSCAYVGSISAFDQTYDYNYGEIGIDNPFVRNERDRHELELTYDFDNGGTLQAMGFTSEEYYERATDSDLFNNEFGFERDPTDIDEQYFELRYASTGDAPFRYGGGVSWYDYEFLTIIYRNSQDFIDQLNGTQISEKATNTGYFFNVAYDLTDQWTASLEGRYQDDDVVGFNPLTGAELGQATTSFLPRFALTFSPSDDFTVYFQAAKGNNPAGVNAGALNEALIAGFDSFPGEFDGFDILDFALFNEEEVLSLELGVKGTWADKMTYAVNYYQLDWENYTQPFVGGLDFTPDDFVDVDGNNVGDDTSIYEGMRFAVPGRNFFGAGDVEGQGIELETSYIATDNLRFGLAASWIDISYDSGACSSIYSPAYGVTPNATTPLGLACVDVEGQQIGTQPKLSGALSVDYNMPLDNGMEWFTRWSTRYTGSQYASEMNLAKLGSYMISDIRTGLSADAWRAEAYVTNLFDEDAPQGIQLFHDGEFGNNPPPFRQNLVYTARRGTAFGVRLSYDFGG